MLGYGVRYAIMHLSTQSHIISINNKDALTSVDVCVFLHVRFLVKSFSAELAGIGSGVGMYEKMCG